MWQLRKILVVTYMYTHTIKMSLQLGLTNIKVNYRGGSTLSEGSWVDLWNKQICITPGIRAPLLNSCSFLTILVFTNIKMTVNTIMLVVIVYTDLTWWRVYVISINMIVNSYPEDCGKLQLPFCKKGRTTNKKKSFKCHTCICCPLKYTRAAQIVNFIYILFSYWMNYERKEFSWSWFHE